MNVLETYVTNIQSVERVPNLDFCLYEIVCDTDCWGRKEYGVKIQVNGSDYQMIKDKGYYLT